MYKFDYIVYKIRRTSDGKEYVGITRRELKVRIGFHCTEAMFKGVHPGGLAVAIRSIRKSGEKFEECFSYSVLEKFCSDKNHALTREKFWVESLNTRYPNGFNIQPGGSSAGSVENGIPITLIVENTEYDFESISEAVAWVNSRKENEYLDEATVRWRLAQDWPIDEAFGFAEHIDQRTIREPFVFDSVEYDSLRVVSNISGIPIATLRSRLQRARENDIEDYDLAIKMPIKWFGSSLLPHPKDEELDGISSREFERLTNISQTTISRRAKKYRTQTPEEKQNRLELLNYILLGEERSTNISLELPNGFDFNGSINQLARVIEQEESLQKYRKSFIKYSTLRKRLQKLFTENSSPNSAEILNSVDLVFNSA